VRSDVRYVLHFSEDPTIARFEPHVAATAQQSEAYVWAVGPDRYPDYWFPRDCPRAMAWVTPETSEADARWLGTRRVHVVEYGWLDRIRSVDLYAYRLPADTFTPFGDHEHAVVSTVPVEPTGPPERLGDLLALHEAAGIELRLVDNLWPWWDVVTTTTLGFSGIRLANARQRRSSS
jgi:hypothetical protein